MTADIIYFNGHVITMEPDMPSAEALAVLGENILHVGTDDETLALAGPETQLIDLGGRALLPGFIDVHNHILGFALAGRNPQLFGTTLEEAQQYMLRGGTTAMGDPGPGYDSIDEYLAFGQTGRVRTNLYPKYNTNCGEPWGETQYLDYPPILDPSAMVRITGVKFYADGGSCNLQAFSFELPEDLVSRRGLGDPRGDLFVSEEELTTAILGLQAAGYQAVVHALGDRAVETVLSSIENALGGQPNTYRHRIDHNSNIHPDDISRYGEIGVVAVIFGFAGTCRFEGSGGVHPRYGEAVTPMFLRGRSLLDANPGLHVGWHSDAPYVGIGPIPDLYWLVTRQGIGEDGVTVCQPPDWMTAEAITVEEALQIMTIGSAYAIFMEDKIGSLKPGKFADLIILSDNPLTVDPDSLIDLEVLMTMVGGQVEYCGAEDLCPAPPAVPTPTGAFAVAPTSTPTSPPPVPVSRMDVPYGPDERQRLDVFTKEDFKDAPIVVLVHGGGWRAGNKASQHRYVDFYNKLGFVVVTPNYRLVTEDGLNTFPTPINDVGCAVAWIKSNATDYGADGSTMFIGGHSAGAHIGAMLAYNSERNWLEDCGIQHEELVFKGFIGTSGRYDLADPSQERFVVGWLLRDVLGLEVCDEEECKWKDTDPGKWAEASPIVFVSPGDPPALLATGGDDCYLNVPDPTTGQCIANSVRMSVALDELGIYNELVVFPGYGHGGYQGLLYDGEEIVDFLENILGANDDAGAAAGAPPGVTLIERRECGDVLTCYDVVVVCQGLPPREVIIGARHLSGSKGAVVFVGGGYTTRFYGGSGAVDLHADGYETYQLAYQGDLGYFTGSIGAGLKNISCGTSELIKWIASELADNPNNIGAHGTSAGSMQLGYGLTLYGLGGILDVVVLAAGPIQSDLVSTCFTYAFPARGLVLDYAHDWVGNGDYCQNGSGPDWLIPILEADSIVSPDPVEVREYRYSRARVVFIEGEDDAGMAEVSRLFYDAITSEKTWIVLPGVGHVVSADPTGAEAILGELREGLVGFGLN
ncbi:MAG: amidohydrolase family protein [Chloroflexi bacterium]|nr:amidohydrolase family protein [Chloroflexota bacterium]